MMLAAHQETIVHIAAYKESERPRGSVVLAAAEELAAERPVNPERALFVALLRARQAEMRGLIDRILAWVGADDEETMESAAEAVVEHEQATRRRARKPARPAVQQSLFRGGGL